MSAANKGAPPQWLSTHPSGTTRIGDIEANTTLDFSAGIARDSYTLEFFVQNLSNEDAALYKTSQCAESVCGVQPYGVRPQPRTFGLKFTQKF